MKLGILFVATLLSLGALILLSPSGTTPRAAAQGASVQGPVVHGPVTPKSFDGDLTSLPQVSGASISPHLVPRHSSGHEPGAAGRDPVVQTQHPAAAMPAPLQNFAGLDFNAWGSGWPPDPNGDVGPNHYIQTVNVSIGIFTKTGTRLWASTFDKFWSAAGGTGTPCDQANQGDPVVVYDALVDRWIITDFAFPSSGEPSYECIAVSKGSNPVSGGWWFYPVLADSALFSDYPKWGIWADGYYMSANMYSGTNLSSVRVWAFDRNRLINGQPVNPVTFELPCGATTCYSTLLPANLRGAQPPSGSPELFASIDAPSTDTLHLWRLHFDPTTPSNSWFGTSAGNSNPIDLAVAHFVEPCDAASIMSCIPEPGATSNQYLDSLGDRLMMQLQYRNIGGIESLWATHTVADSASIGSVTGIRWYEVRDPNGTPVLYQQSTFAPDTTYRWMPSLAVDKLGNLAVGYSAASSTLYPSIRYAGRLAADPLNVLGQDETTLITGTGAQTFYPGVGNLNRWGDYSAMTVDPVDDCTFWYTNEYYAATGYNWQTRIGSFKFPGCLPPPSPVTIQDNNPRVQYDGWTGVFDSAANGGSYRVSSTANDTVTFGFTGTAVKWIYATGPDKGMARVLIDGKDKGTVDLCSATPQSRANRKYGNLALGAHTLILKVLGTSTCSGAGVVVDAFQVASTTFQENSKAIQYNNWKGLAQSRASGSTYRYSVTKGEVARLDFEGTAVTWFTVKGPSYGKADVYIDGAHRETVDLYARRLQWRVPFKYSVSGTGSHSIEIRVLHTKNQAATNFRVAIDAFLATP